LAGAATDRLTPLSRLTSLSLAPLSVGAAVVGAVDGWAGGLGESLVWVGLTLVWAVAGAELRRRRGDEHLGFLALWFATLAGAAALASAIAADRPGDDALALVQALCLALLPAAAMHVLLALPTASVRRGFALRVTAAYVLAGGVGVLVWTGRPSSAMWPLVIEAAVAGAIGVNGVMSRYRLGPRGPGWRVDSIALAVAAFVELVLVGLTVHVLIGWPPHLLHIAAVATIPIPLALLLEGSKRFRGSIGGLAVRAISVAGLTAVVAAVYLLVVFALGRAPTDDERTLVLLSMVAAGITALLYVHSRSGLVAFTNRLLYGRREAPDALVRGLGRRLSRSVPLDELLLQLAESLRGTLGVEGVEVWTASAGTLERLVSDPDRGPATLRLTAAEEPVVAGAGVSGRAWIAVWLPRLLEGRGDAPVRIAPITHARQLYGLLLVDGTREAERFDVDVETVLAEVSRQLGLVFHNMRLDSELQASLDELRRQADELRASRARIVETADAERRRIERDLHDGAQQYLVGMAANLRVAHQLTDSDPERAKAILAELGSAARDAMNEFRDLAHGVYPPLLQDRGLAEALAYAARRASIPTRVEVTGVRRYEQAIESTVYFCCLEALQNAAKHAGGGANATVRVREEERALLFEVADDGCGLDPSRASIGAGVTNMQDRLGAIGGSLRIESAPHTGTTFAGTIPLAS